MVEVDCRGHPIEGGDPNNEADDFANLILVGIWLAVKENGETLQNLLKWAELPEND